MPAAFLLDAHLDPKLADILRQRGIETVSMQEWQGGHYLSLPDIEIISAAERDGLTLISYDVHSIPTLLQRLAQEGTSHGGVILVSSRTIPSRALSPLADAIERLVADLGDVDWRNRLVFLRR